MMPNNGPNLSNPYLLSMLLGLVDAQFAPTAFSPTYKPKRVVQSPIFSVYNTQTQSFLSALLSIRVRDYSQYLIERLKHF